MKTFEELRKEYNYFYYKDYKIEKLQDSLHITFIFSIPNLQTFTPTLDIPIKGIDLQKKDFSFIEYLVFHIGLVEVMSYWKNVCPKNVIIEAGYLDEKQINWFKNLYFYGLGEFFYTNHIHTTKEDFMDIKATGKRIEFHPEFKGIGNLIPIGGGKDSCVTLSLLENEQNNKCFILNPKEVTLACAHAANYKENDIIGVKRTLDPNMIHLKDLGYLNGHTPFSSLLAFVSYLTAYLYDKKNIILSNEGSANESNILNTKINHQYSKTYEFENDFNHYTKEYFQIEINYFSLLRPLSEYQIGMLFSKLEKFHPIFKSCNVGSKEKPWVWCCTCPKCLFVFSILSPYLYKEKLISIFGEDLFEKEELLKTFIDLLGYGKTKPFECVGTFKEVNYAISKTIRKLEHEKKTLPFLLQYFKEHYECIDTKYDLENEFNEENNLDVHFTELIKRRLKHD